MSTQPTATGPAAFVEFSLRAVAPARPQPLPEVPNDLTDQAEGAHASASVAALDLATCPACGLQNIPVTDGKLAAHAWYPRGQPIPGLDDAEGNPTPGEWRGWCKNLDPTTKPGEAGG